jgi:hypothetical protein
MHAHRRTARARRVRAGAPDFLPIPHPPFVAVRLFARVRIAHAVS